MRTNKRTLIYTSSINSPRFTLPLCMTETIEIPAELAYFQLPDAVQERLQFLLDRQDSGEVLTQAERREAQGLVELAEFLSLLRLRSRAYRRAGIMTAIPASLRRLVIQRAGDRCEYCGLSQAGQAATFHNYTAVYTKR